MSETTRDLAEIEAARARIRATHLRTPDQRPASTARGLHHTALISSDVERTVRFYQDAVSYTHLTLPTNREV